LKISVVYRTKQNSQPTSENRRLINLLQRFSSTQLKKSIFTTKRKKAILANNRPQKHKPTIRVFSIYKKALGFALGSF